MKISLLQEREDFDAVFSRSFADFLAAYFARPIPIVPSGQGDMTFRRNVLLNVIFPTRIAPDVLTDLTAEFRYAPSAARRALQIAYCSLAVRWPAATFLSPPSFDLTDPPAEVTGWVILPGNHSIRVIDTMQNVSLVFRKHGFDTRFFLRDAQMRRDNPDLPAPAVLEIDSNGQWYREERVHGLPLNRLASKRDADAALVTLIQALAVLRDRSAQDIQAQHYAGELGASLRASIAEMRPGIAEIASAMEALVDRAEAEINAVPAFPLTLSETHGDFQPANILVNGSRVWLIDWEYSGTRSAIYDNLVFVTQSRFPAGFGARLARTYEAAESAGGVQAWGFLQKGPASALMALFLLEELTVKLAEVAAPAITNKQTSLKPWVQEVVSTATKMFSGTQTREN